MNKALNILTSNKINMTRITSKPAKFVENNWRQVDFFVDLEGKLTDENVQTAISQLNLIADKVTEVGSVEVPWFPTRIEDFDHIGRKVLDESEIGERDHPSFRDQEYRKRRGFITDLAFKYNVRDESIPTVDYNENELGVWRYCYPKLKNLLKTNACDETNSIMEEMEKNVEGFGPSTIP